MGSFTDGSTKELLCTDYQFADDAALLATTIFGTENIASLNLLLHMTILLSVVK